MENSENPIPIEQSTQEAENSFKFREPLITQAEIRQNFTLLSDFTHALARSESYTSQESKVKYEYYCNVKRAMFNYGVAFSIVPPLAFIRYAIVSRYIGRKVFFCLCTTLFNSHIYWLGQNFAIYRNLKPGLDSFCIDTDYELGSQMENF